MNLGLALEWARPAAAWALALPLFFLLLVRVLRRPPEAVIGTLELWRELAPARAGGRARGGFPPWALACALGLLLGALAWLGPRAGSGPAPRRWTVLVDRSPSMGLPLAGSAGATRLEAALAAAEEWLRATLDAGDRVRWLSPARAPLELARGERPPQAWLAGDARAHEPDWPSHDLPGTVWVTDRAPERPRAAAALFASGGAACPGPIALEGGEDVCWGPEGLTRRARAEPPAVSVEEPEGARLPPVVEDVLAAWCAARGFALARTPRAGPLLVVALAGGPLAAETLHLARDGWQATGRAAALPARAAERPGEDWLAGTAPDGARRTVVRVLEGRIELGLRELSEPSGDPAGFALSWARLLERACTLPADVVPLEERLAAGAPVAAPGRPPAPEPGPGSDRGATLDAGLALAAALCAGLALLLHGRA